MRSTEPRRRMLIFPPKASGFARYTAIIVWSMPTDVSECRLRAILVSVSPLPTRYVLPVTDGAARSGAGDGLATGALGAGAGGGATAGAGRRAGAGALVGAVTGVALLAVSPGVYTGGSSSTVYSRIRRPRAQLTSTKKVTKGSGIESVERTSKTSRPSLLLPTLKVSVDRNGGRSMPYRVKASFGARAARSAVNSSGLAAIRSISAFIGSFSAEFRCISPRPKPHDNDGINRHAISMRRDRVTNISTPRILVGKR